MTGEKHYNKIAQNEVKFIKILIKYTVLSGEIEQINFKIIFHMTTLSSLQKTISTSLIVSHGLRSF